MAKDATYDRFRQQSYHGKSERNEYEGRAKVHVSLFCLPPRSFASLAPPLLHRMEACVILLTLLAWMLTVRELCALSWRTR